MSGCSINSLCCVWGEGSFPLADVVGKSPPNWLIFYLIASLEYDTSKLIVLGQFSSKFVILLGRKSFKSKFLIIPRAPTRGICFICKITLSMLENTIWLFFYQRAELNIGMKWQQWSVINQSWFTLRREQLIAGKVLVFGERFWSGSLIFCK